MVFVEWDIQHVISWFKRPFEHNTLAVFIRANPEALLVDPAQGDTSGFAVDEEERLTNLNRSE